MDKKIVFVSTVFLLAFVGLWLTGGSTQVQRLASTESPADPAKFAKAVHLGEHGVRIGDDESSHVRVKRDNGKIKVEIRRDFLVELPESFLPALGWTEPTNWVSEEGYQEFLLSLDSIYHGNEDGSDHAGHGHEQTHDGHEHDHSDDRKHTHHHDHDGHDHH